MISQVQLALLILNSAVLFFVQKHPPTLGRFRWRIDQKNSEKTEYEEAFSQVLPAFLQTASLNEPMPMLKGANYSWFNRFYFPKGEEPTYLRDVYGIDTADDADDRKLNLGQLVREDVAFVDSESNLGVQVADLLVAGLRRCFRNGFTRNHEVSMRLGRLMVQRGADRPPVQLIGFGLEDKTVGEQVHRTAVIMRESARGMLAL